MNPSNCHEAFGFILAYETAVSATILGASGAVVVLLKCSQDPDHSTLPDAL
jgi:hypothetical protein